MATYSPGSPIFQEANLAEVSGIFHKQAGDGNFKQGYVTIFNLLYHALGAVQFTMYFGCTAFIFVQPC